MIKTGKFLIPIVIMVALAATLSSCSTANQESPLSLVDASGNHPDGWITAHESYARPNGSFCIDCHGSGLAGGISDISCATAGSSGQECHANGPAFHPEYWVNKDAIGNSWHAEAKRNGLLIRNTFGIFECLDCHDPFGSDYILDPGDCTECHFTDSGNKTPGGGWTHPPPYDDNHSDFADSPSVKSICVKCHEVNNSFGNKPFCHNCHDIHPEPDWDLRSLHGVAAKQSPGTMTGFVTCASCHGDNYDGGSSGITCLSQIGCHPVDAPHPDGSDWRGESTPTHTNTSTANAPQCFLCHEDGANSGEDPPNPPAGTPPGCYNNTLCHADED